jgi:signal peptidase I
VSACLTWLIAIIVLGFLLTSFGSIKMAGSGMSPTLPQGDRALYHKRVDWQHVRPGAVIVYRNADDSPWGKPDWLMVSRILAGPGDTLSVADGRYVVNGKIGPAVGPTGAYAPVIDVPTSPAAITVPQDCYFVAQDSPAGGLDSRVLSWVRKEKLVSARLWHRRLGSILEPVR